MRPRTVNSPWDYLRQASFPALQSFELSRLNHAANLRKEIDVLFDEYLQETASALLARFLMDKSNKREALTRGRPRALIEAETASTARPLARGRPK
jgi:hypothetical protein